MAGRYLAAIGEAGLLTGTFLAVDDGDFVPGLVEIIGRAYADHAGSENDDFQNANSWYFSVPGVIGIATAFCQTGQGYDR